jgi:hypothetical protein
MNENKVSEVKDLQVEVEVEEGTEFSEAPIGLIPKIDLVPHTVFLLCGPTQSGKSQFSEDIHILSSSNLLHCTVISSDEIRKELLLSSPLSPLFGTADMVRYTDAMLSVSRAAFEILETKFRTAVSFPVRSEIVVVDTTGMDERFRAGILAEGRRNGYKVVLVTFEYKNRSEYIPQGATQEVKDIIENSVMKFRRKILPNLKSGDYDGRLRIKSKDAFGWDRERENSWWFEDSIATWEDHALSDLAKEKLNIYTGCQDLHFDPSSGLSEVPTPTYAIIGDSHECVEELKILIGMIEKEYPGTRIVHIGDYLDKGGETEAMVNFMYERVVVRGRKGKSGSGGGDLVIVGNHESYVYKRLTGEVKPNVELETSYFTSVPVLEGNSDLAEKFFEIFRSSLPFAVLCDFDEGGGLPIYVTHAPCENKYLGKVHNEALIAQRNYRVKDREKDVFNEFSWLFKEADTIHPLHVFGHISHNAGESGKPKLNFKNKVFLDTGVVYGGSLSAVIVSKGKVCGTLFCKATKQRAEATLPTGLVNGPKKEVKFNIYDYDLDVRDLRLLDSVMDNGVKYISGTMAPAPSTDTDIEPLRAALDWFKKAGAETVVLQPKYMGSRAQLYLFAGEPDKTFMVSRGGWKIRGVEGLDDEGYKKFLTEEYNKRESLIKDYGDMVLDGELMPWAALGKGLIETHFTPYKALIEEELRVLEVDPGLAMLGDFKSWLDVEGRKGDLTKFQSALECYSGNTAVEFKPFKVLSHSKGQTGIVDITSNFDGFTTLNNGLTPCYIDLRNGEGDYGVAEDYFKELTEVQKMEGVVVKPLVGTCDIPYMKVRSKEYLRLVYGYDYTRPERHARLCRQKNISGKVRTSINEHKLAEAMLMAEGDAKKELVVKMIGQMKSEKALDPRL